MPYGYDLSNVNTLSLSEAAQAYCRAGIAVFPVEPGEKRPIEGWMWQTLNTMNPDQARAWWDHRPEANIGLVMGKASGVMALDLDTGKNKNGFRSLQDIQNEDPLHLCVQITPNGQHFLFKYHPGISNFTNKGRYGGIDMRTEGGYIVGAPSMVKDSSYVWNGASYVPAREPPPLLLEQCLTWSNESQAAKHNPVPKIPEISFEEIENLLQDCSTVDRDFLLYGVNPRPDNDDSHQLYSTTLNLLRKVGRDEGLVLAILDQTYAMQIAERHRRRRT